MPSLSVSKSYMRDLCGKPIDDSVFEQTIFDFGIELDDIYEENGETMYKFDIPANRYDLLCAEGMVSAMRSYMFLEEYKEISAEPATITVTKEDVHERKYIACAVIRDINFNENSYESFISYQDKLHSSIGRNRSLVAIGTHDLNKIKGEISYKSINLEDISFKPLNSTSEVKGCDLISHFQKDKKISKYFNLLTDSSKSVIFQCGSTVMSLPPIINSEDTKISIETKNIFIEATGTDFNKVNTAVKLILYNFRGSKVESVRIKGPDGTITTPVFNYRTYEFSSKRLSDKLNLSLSDNDIKNLLTKMMYRVSMDKHLVHIPDARSDIMHECDIIEDVAIGYGFNNFTKKMPDIFKPGSEDALNKFTDKIRLEISLCGFNEALTLTLLSKEENFVNQEKQIVIGNPKSREFEVARTSLLPGLLKSISSNLHARIPIKIFESADVVLLSNAEDEGAVNRRYLCGVLASNTPLLEDLQGPLSFLFEKCGISNYSYKPMTDHRYLENQSASVLVGDRVVGSIGVLHPNVCCGFKIPYAASSFEVDLEAVHEIYHQNLN